MPQQLQEHDLGMTPLLLIQQSRLSRIAANLFRIRLFSMKPQLKPILRLGYRLYSFNNPSVTWEYKKLHDSIFVMGKIALATVHYDDLGQAHMTIDSRIYGLLGAVARAYKPMSLGRL